MQLYNVLPSRHIINKNSLLPPIHIMQLNNLRFQTQYTAMQCTVLLSSRHIMQLNNLLPSRQIMQMNNILPSRHNMQLKNLLCIAWLNNLIYLYIKNIADRTNNLNLSGDNMYIHSKTFFFLVEPRQKTHSISAKQSISCKVTVVKQ